MFRLPVGRETLPHTLLDGKGALVVRALGDADKPFDEQLARGEGKLIDVSLETDVPKPLRLGTGQISVALGAEVLLDIIWPNETEGRQVLEAFGLSFESDDQMYVALTAHGRAEAGADIAVPTGSVATSVKGGAINEVTFRHLKPFDRHLKSGEVLRQFFRSMRLPFDVETANGIPEKGEVLYLEYRGYLKFGLSAAWGCTFSKYHDVKLGGLSLDQHVDVAAAARVSADVRVAGSHGFELRHGSRPGWVRLIVRKHRENALDVGADVSIRAKLETEGLPDDAHRFLEVMLGLRMPDVAREVAGLLGAGPDQLFDRLQAEADELIDRYLLALYREWFDEVVSRDSVQAFFERLRGATESYEALKELDERAVALVEAYADREDRLWELVDRVLGLPCRSELEQITEPALWDVLQQYLGDRLLAFVTSDETFEGVTKRLRRWRKKAANETLLSFIRVRREAFNMSSLFDELDELVDVLKSVDTPEEVRRRSAGYLLELARRLTGTAFDELRGSRLHEEVETLQSLLNRLDGFQDALYRRVESTLNDAHRLNLSWSYARAREKTALIDVEINLERGRALLQRALLGDFQDVMRAPDPEVVRVRPSLFTVQVRAASTLKVDVLGWQYEWLRDLVLRTEEVVRPQGDGLLHVYRLEAEERVARRTRDEETKMHFLFGLLAEGREPDLIDTVSRLAVDYTFNITDAKTSGSELRAYLRLAEHLQMIPRGGTEELLKTLREEMRQEEGSGWGSVTIDYRVRYDPEALLSIFRFLPRPSLKGITREAFRRITSANYRSFGGRQYEAIADMILDDRIYWAWKTPEAHLGAETTYCYEVEGQAQQVCIDRFRRNVLHVLYDVEDDLVETLVQLDDVLDRAREARTKPSRKQLEEAIRRFVRQRRRLEKWMTIREADRYVSPFFAILDQLIAVFSNARASRAMMQLRFERPDAESVTKVLTARPPS